MQNLHVISFPALADLLCEKTGECIRLLRQGTDAPGLASCKSFLDELRKEIEHRQQNRLPLQGIE